MQGDAQKEEEMRRSVSSEKVTVNMLIYIICDFFTQVFFHKENFADLLTWTLHYSQDQRIVSPLEFHTLWNTNTKILVNEIQLYKINAINHHCCY